MKSTPTAGALLLLLAASAGGPAAQETSEEEPAAKNERFLELTHRLEAQDWAPPYFADRVAMFDPSAAELLLRSMEEEPFTGVPVANIYYRTSPLRVQAGKGLFMQYDWGSADQWQSTQRYLFYALGLTSTEELQSRYGIGLGPDGRLVGLVGLRRLDGRIDYGWSCALCHAGPGDEGTPVPGVPNHRYNQGLFRYRGLMEHDPHPDFVKPGYIDRDIPIEHLKALGPGRLDLNSDRVENPVKIPSLWGLREARRGVFANGSAGNLWVIIGGHNGGSSPASSPLEALVAYLLSLEPPENPKIRGKHEDRGAAVFEKAGCAECHSGPYYTNGEVIPLEIIGTDPARVRQEFPKGYRVPSLRRLDLERLYLHDGSISSLPELFSKDRLGTVPGHEYGLDLKEKEKRDLVAFLLSL